MDEFFLHLLIKPGNVIFDIGANHGTVADFMAQCAGINGKVVAFEPIWRVYERMCERIQQQFIARAPIITMPLGLSDKTEITEIHIPDNEDCLASIAPVSSSDSSNIRTLKCGIITLDTFVETTGIQQPQLVKIDVEGAEFRVLKGGKRVFEHEHPPILFTEIIAPWLKNFGDTPWDILGYLQNLGYEHLFMCADGLVEHKATEATPFPKAFRDGYNVISLVPGKHGEIKDQLIKYQALNKPSLPPMDSAIIANE